MTKIKGVKGAFTLEIETFTIVPSTKNKTQKVSDIVFNRRVKETQVALRTFFGGTTRVKGHGEYELKGKFIPEKVSIVYSFSRRKDFLKNKQKWINWVKKKRAEWSQDSIGIGIEGDMYYI